MTNRIILFILLLIVSSCKPDKDISEIERYLSSNLNLRIPSKQLYIFLPSDTCNSCVKLTIKQLLTQKEQLDNITVIFIGNTLKELKYLGNELEPLCDVINDYNSYKSNNKFLYKLSSPALLIINKSKTNLIYYSIDKNFDLMPLEINSFLNM